MDVNYVALLVAGVASMIIGYLWYSKTLFGNQRMKLSKVSEADIKAASKEMPKLYGTMYLASLVMAYVVAMFISKIGVTDVMGGVTVAFWAWLGFIATTMLTGVLYERKPLNLYFINAGYQLVTLVVMGAILGAMQ